MGREVERKAEQERGGKLSLHRLVVKAEKGDAITSIFTGVL